MPSDNIVTLNPVEAVRTRPGMYLGSTENTSKLLDEIVGNCIDEIYRSPKSHTINIEMSTTKYRVSDDGRGIPTKASLSDPTITMTRESLQNLHSGSKFHNTTASIGMNGIGSSAVNFLSETYTVYSNMKLQNPKELPEGLKKLYKNEKYYYCRFKKGYFDSEGFVNIKSDYSTIVEYVPDPTIFESTEATLPISLKYTTYIAKVLYNKSLDILVNGKSYDLGVKNYHTNMKLEGHSAETDNSYNIFFSVSIKNKYENYEGDGSVNGLYVPNGLHIRWTHRAFTKAFNQLFGTDYSVDEIIYGLDMRVIMTTEEPNFNGQIKENLSGIKGFPIRGDQEIDKLVAPILKELKKDKQYWEIHNKRIQSLIDAKNKINTRDLVKDTFDVDNKKRKKLPSKLMDCTTKDRSKAELYICEGASAQSSLVQARDSKIHAVLALRGKMLNTVGKTIEEIIGNKEVNDIINAIGIGTRDYCKPKNIRYGKIIITADSDSDGYNIASLILGLLYTHIPKVIEMGIVYLSVQPLFKVGNQYVYSDTLQGVNTKGKTVERYKGLGSVNPKDMKSMALDPKTRKLVKVTMKDAEYATQIMTSAAIKGEILVKNDVIVI